MFLSFCAVFFHLQVFVVQKSESEESYQDTGFRSQVSNS